MKKYYYNGCAVVVSGRPSTGNSMILEVVEVLTDRNDIVVGKELYVTGDKKLTRLISEQFNVGDDIEVIKGSFEGTVVGYDYAKNAAVCISDRIRSYSNDRTRYSYFGSELRKKGSNIHRLEHGKTYIIDGDRYLAIENTNRRNTMDLLNTNFEAVYMNVPKRIRESDLEKY